MLCVSCKGSVPNIGVDSLAVMLIAEQGWDQSSRQELCLPYGVLGVARRSESERAQTQLKDVVGWRFMHDFTSSMVEELLPERLT